MVEETQDVLGADASAVRCTQRSPRIFGPHFADWPDGAPCLSDLTVRTQPYSCVGSCTAQWWAPIPRGSPFPGGAVPDAAVSQKMAVNGLALTERSAVMMFWLMEVLKPGRLLITFRNVPRGLANLGRLLRSSLVDSGDGRGPHLLR